MVRKSFAVLILIIAITTSAQAGEFKKWLRQWDGEHYQQDRFQLEDPKGDAFLIRKLDEVPMKLFRSLMGKDKYPQADGRRGAPDATPFDSMTVAEFLEMAEAEEQELVIRGTEIDENDSVLAGFQEHFDAAAFEDKIKQKQLEYAFLERALATDPDYSIGKNHPIHVERLLTAFQKVIQENPDITPTLGTEHLWSKDAKKYLVYGWWDRLVRFIFRKQKEFPAPLFSSSKLFLCLACGWTSRYTVAAQEAKLEEIIMAHPDRSVNIHDVFSESYRLNNGNIYLTLLTCENMLAKNPYRPDRDKDPLQKKLFYLRNDNLALGDNYGAWYHFFGIAMYAFQRPALVSRAVAEIESFGSLFLEGSDPQEDYINRLGAIFGNKLKNMIKKGSWKLPINPDYDKDYLLNSMEVRTQYFTDADLINREIIHYQKEMESVRNQIRDYEAQIAANKTEISKFLEKIRTEMAGKNRKSKIRKYQKNIKKLTDIEKSIKAKIADCEKEIAAIGAKIQDKEAELLKLNANG